MRSRSNGTPYKEADYVRRSRLICEEQYPEIKREYLSGISLKESLDSRGIGSRNRIESMLKDDGVELRNTSTMHTPRSREKSRQTCLHKYGVDNGSKQLSIRTQLSLLNQKNKQLWQGKREVIEYIMGKGPQPDSRKDFIEYKSKCLELTEISKHTLPPVDVCYYTGIKFDEARFNGLFSRSVDHKLSIVYGFLHQVSPSEIGSLKNLVWCCRIVNSMKRELTESQFISQGIPERIVNAYQKNYFS